MHPLPHLHHDLKKQQFVPDRARSSIGLTVSAGGSVPQTQGHRGLVLTVTGRGGPVVATQGDEHWGARPHCSPVWTLCKPLSLPVPPFSPVRQSINRTSRRHRVAVRFEVIISVKPLDQCLAVSVCYYEYTRLKRWN